MNTATLSINSVAFYEKILEVEMPNFEKLIKSKSEYLKRLQNTPFEKLNSNVANQINLIETEISLMVLLLECIENLKIACINDKIKHQHEVIFIFAENIRLKKKLELTERYFDNCSNLILRQKEVYNG